MIDRPTPERLAAILESARNHPLREVVTELVAEIDWLTARVRELESLPDWVTPDVRTIAEAIEHETTPLNKRIAALERVLDEMIGELDIALGYVRADGHATAHAEHGSDLLRRARAIAAAEEQDPGNAPRYLSPTETQKINCPFPPEHGYEAAEEGGDLKPQTSPSEPEK